MVPWLALGLVLLAVPGCMSAPDLAADPAVEQGQVQDAPDDGRAGEGADIEDVAIEGYARVERNPLFPVGIYDAPVGERSHLTGGWGGARKDLADRGVLVHGEATFVGSSVFDGGLDEEEDGLWKGDLIVKLDGARMGLWEGGFGSIRVEARGGESVNPEAGTLMPVDAVALFPSAREEDDIVDLTEALVTQFLSPHVALSAGLIQTLDGDVMPGAQGRGVEHFMNVAMVFNPLAMVTVPYSTLGVALSVFVNEKSYGSLTVMDTEESSGHDKFDTNDGTTYSADWILVHQLRGQPGAQRFAATYADMDFTRLDQDLRNFIPGLGTVELEDDSWALFYSAFQAFDGKGYDRYGVYRGWGAGTRLGWSDGDPNPFEWFASLHLAGYGVADSRPMDRFGLGYYYLGLTDANIVDLLPVDDEQGVEAFYSFALTPSVYLSADLQYVDTGLNFADDAWVAQLRLFSRL